MEVQKRTYGGMQRRYIWGEGLKSSRSGDCCRCRYHKRWIPGMRSRKRSFQRSGGPEGPEIRWIQRYGGPDIQGLDHMEGIKEMV